MQPKSANCIIVVCAASLLVGFWSIPPHSSNLNQAVRPEFVFTKDELQPFYRSAEGKYDAVLYISECGACSLLSLRDIEVATKSKQRSLLVLTKPNLISGTRKLTKLPVKDVAEFYKNADIRSRVERMIPNLVLFDSDGTIESQLIGVEMIQDWSHTRQAIRKAPK